MSDLAKGFFPKAKHENAPDFVIGKLSIKREDAIAWLEAQSDEWVRLDMKVSKAGKGYAEVDDWKPSNAQSVAPETNNQPPTFEDDEIPF